MKVVPVDAMLDALEALRSTPTEDAILDLMDRVSGHCSPHARLAVDPLADLRRAIEKLPQPTLGLKGGVGRAEVLAAIDKAAKP